MRRFAIIPIIVLAALLGFGLVAAQSGSTTPIPYIYRIDIKGCKFEPAIRRQTGFRVQGIAGVVTALHGVADCTTIHAIADGGQEIFTDLTIQQVDIAHDVALLASAELNELPADGLMASPLSSTEILTATLHIVGYPRGLEKQDVDVIESIRDIESLDDVIPDAEEPADFIKRKSPSLAIDVLNVQAQLLPGHSGAPLLDSEERIVAIGNGGLRSGSDGRSWAIPWNADSLQSIGVADVKEKLDELANKDIAALSFSSTYPNQIDATVASKSYTIQIVDAAKNQPIVNAAVLLTHNAGYESGVTDSEGFHIFHLLTDGIINYAESQIQVEAVGYESYIRNVPNVQKRTSPDKVQLMALSPTPTVTPIVTSTIIPLQLCSFAFLVLDDQSEEPIRKATIAVFVGIRQDTGTTDSTGYYLAKLPCGNGQEVEARVRVSANDYTVYSRSLFLSNETTEILLEHSATPTPTATPEPTATQFTATVTPRVALASPTPKPTADSNVTIELKIEGALASSQQGKTSDSSYVYDGNLDTFWMAKFTGPVIGSWVELLFREPKTISRIGLYRKPSASYSQVKEVTLHFPDGSKQQITFRGVAEWEFVDITPVTTDSTKFEISAISPESTGVIIFELAVFGPEIVQLTLPSETNLTKIAIEGALASSQQGTNTGPSNVYDGNLGASWMSKFTDPVIGSWVGILFREPKTVSRIGLYRIPNSTYGQVKETTLHFSDGSKQHITFRGIAEWEFVDITPVITNDIKVEVSAVSPENIGVVIFELAFFGP